MPDLFDLVAKISLDHSQVDRGLSDVQKKALSAERELKKLDATVKGTSTSLRNDLGGALSAVSPRLGALAGAGGLAGAAAAGLTLIATATAGATAGILKLAMHAAGIGGDLQDMAQQTNFSVRTLSALKVAASTSGSSLDELTGSLGIFQKNLQQASQGNKELQSAFKALGVTSRDNEEALRQVLTGLSNVKDATAQTALSMGVFGRSGKAMLGVSKEIDGQLEANIQKLQKWGLIVSEEDARAADLFSDELETLQTRLGGVARVMGSETLPAFSAFFQSIEASLDANKTNWKSWGETTAKAILTVETVLSGFAKTAMNMGPNFSPLVFLSTIIPNLNKSADEIVGAYNKLVNPNVGGDFALPRSLRSGSGFGLPTNTRGAGRAAAEPKTVDGWKKALEMLQRVNDQMADEVRRFDEEMARVSSSVSTAIIDQAFAIKALEANTPDWLQHAQEFIRAKTDEGYAWAADTKQIYLNNAARLEQLRVLAQGATRPRTVTAFMKGSGTEDNFLGAFGKGDAAAAGQELARRTEQYAFELTSILDNAIYAGFRDGGSRGIASLGLGLLDMLNNVFFRRMEEGLSMLLSGSGGGWGVFFKSLIGVGSSALGGGFTKGGGLIGGTLGKYADGGFMSPYSWGIVGERGPEIVRAGSQGATVTAGAGQTFHFHFHGPANQYASRETQAQLMRRARQQFQKSTISG